MRVELAIWLFALVIGIGTYLIWYVFIPWNAVRGDFWAGGGKSGNRSPGPGVLL